MTCSVLPTDTTPRLLTGAPVRDRLRGRAQHGTQPPARAPGTGSSPGRLRGHGPPSPGAASPQPGPPARRPRRSARPAAPRSEGAAWGRPSPVRSRLAPGSPPAAAPPIRAAEAEPPAGRATRRQPHRSSAQAPPGNVVRARRLQLPARLGRTAASEPGLRLPACIAAPGRPRILFPWCSAAAAARSPRARGVGGGSRSFPGAAGWRAPRTAPCRPSACCWTPSSRDTSCRWSRWPATSWGWTRVRSGRGAGLVPPGIPWAARGARIPPAVPFVPSRCSAAGQRPSVQGAPSWGQPGPQHPESRLSNGVAFRDRALRLGFSRYHCCSWHRASLGLPARWLRGGSRCLTFQTSALQLPAPGALSC